MAKLVLPVRQFKRFDDPFAQGRSPELPIKYCFYVRTSDVPGELLDWMNPNPRDQNLDSGVSKTIRQSLQEDNRSFHLWNKGLLIAAEHVTYDNQTNLATIYLEDPQIHGDIDGGHTLKIILQCREEWEKRREQAQEQGQEPPEPLPEQYVMFEVITGLDSPVELAEARNTNVPVDTKSMEELRGTFDYLKEVIRAEPIQGDEYFSRIAFRQNQMKGRKNPIDVREIVAILNMFNLDLYPNDSVTAPSPIQSFSGKEVSLKKFLQMGLEDGTDEEQKARRNRVLRDMAPIIPDIFRLWDHIECHFTEATVANDRRYGAKKHANYNRDVEEKDLPKAMFSSRPLRYTIPRGILYPVVGAFRALVRTDDAGTYYWAANPIGMWEELKEVLAEYVMSTSQELSNNPNAIGKSKNLWSNLFLTVRDAIR